MFEPVAVPGQGEEPTGRVLLAEIEHWVFSPPLRRLVRRFGYRPWRHPLRLLGWWRRNRQRPRDLVQELAYLDELTARTWDYRQPGSTDSKERNQVDPDAITGADEKLVLAAADALGLVQPRPPKYQHYDHVVVLGGLVRANLWRSAYAAHLLSSGITAENVVALTAYRDLAKNDNDPGKDEPTLLERFGLPLRSYEWEVMEDGLRRAFGLSSFEIERQSDPAAEGPARFRVAVAEAAGQQVSLIVAPAADPSRRANTADGYRYWADQIGHVKPGQRVLAVTTCIYVPYQHAVALQQLGLPFGCSIDTVGIDFTVLDDSLSPQDFRGVNYLQEIRSAIRAYRELVRLIGQDNPAEPGR